MSDHPADPGRCPACKTGLVSEISLRWKGFHYIRCGRCGVQSAPRATAEEAREEWSKLVKPPEMKNTLEVPEDHFVLDIPAGQFVLPNGGGRAREGGVARVGGADAPGGAPEADRGAAPPGDDGTVAERREAAWLVVSTGSISRATLPV